MMRRFMTAALCGVLLSTSAVDLASARPFSSHSSSSSRSSSSSLSSLSHSTSLFSRKSTTSSKITGLGSSAPASLKVSSSTPASALGRATALTRARQDLTAYQTAKTSSSTTATPVSSSPVTQAAMSAPAAPAAPAIPTPPLAPQTSHVYVHHDHDDGSSFWNGMMMGEMMEHSHHHDSQPQVVVVQQPPAQQPAAQPAPVETASAPVAPAPQPAPAPAAPSVPQATICVPAPAVAPAHHHGHPVFWTFMVLLIIAVIAGVLFFRRNRLARNMASEATDIVKDKVASVMKPAEEPIKAPLGLTPGTAVTFGAEVRAACLSDDSLFPSMPDNGVTVDSVGTMTIAGRKVVRAYLSDEASFIQLVMGDDADVPEEAVLYTTVMRNTPDRDGLKWLLDEGTGKIGAPTFEVSTADGEVSFQREWSSDVSGRVSPVRTTETIRGTDGSEEVSYQMMAYGRTTSQGPEHLMVELASNESQSELNVNVGKDLTDETLKVYRTS